MYAQAAAMDDAARMSRDSELRSWMPPPAVQTVETPAVGQQAPATSKLIVPARNGKPTIVTFLRHCGCPFAEKTYLSLRAIAPAHPDVDFIAVAHSDQESTDRWLASLPNPSKNTQPNLQIVVDAEREAYAAWGLGNSSLWHILGSILGLSKLKEDGISVRSTESGSRWQTAGNFAVDGQGVVTWSRKDERADDMPDFNEGLDAVLVVRHGPLLYPVHVVLQHNPSIGVPANDLTSTRESAPPVEARRTLATPITSTPVLDHVIMALPTPQMAKRASEYGSDIHVNSIATLSDYGSDIDIDDDTILADFGTTKQGVPTERSLVLPSVEFEQGEIKDEDEYEEQDLDGFVQIHKPVLLRVAKGTTGVDTNAQRNTQSSPIRQPTALEVEYDERSRRLWSVPLAQAASPSTLYPSRSSRTASQVKHVLSPESVTVAETDTLSPLGRFRTKPKKPLSVTDLISPAWCELQYFYTLSKFGRKPRTKAMRTGSKIHQTLEDQVHTSVPVQAESKEDYFGLRIWNAISGLRCLRETGLTRELEVWGVIEGQVVNGVIDELSYTCPDAQFEEQLENFNAEKSGGIVPLPPGQIGISDAFAKASKEGLVTLESDHRQVYIADVKTRGAKSLPTGASLRPTWMQLMLYRKLLESLSLNTVDAETVLLRYDLQPLVPFTNVFLQEIDDMGPHDEASKYPNLLSLWSLLISEIQTVLPPTTLSLVLRAEYRYAKTGDIIGSELIAYDTDVIDKYITEEMDWWQGRREAKGVEIEEAFKCRICDFADSCSWRKTKVEEAVEKSRLRREAKEKSTV
ncbi:defects in morphology 1 [Pyrenophora seminiperda CCB06]|uniref:Defects in morphology 1 n=1 Tax=Pyrenophora seminiperda CCB06 TaxID=1302712 RepID=A0A3M7MEY4_9PLEO|nr:defects in morphology 1 [Pyrenophora seminiperda CCB06]